MYSPDITGKRFGRLIAVSATQRNGKKHWLCRCDCGNDSVVAYSNLNSGQQRSCGCLYRETRAKITTTHGLSKRPEYSVWKSMKGRCYDKNDQDYYLYGGRGIIVCDRWVTKFERFYADMGTRPEGTSIDRINSDGDYEPTNCRWATPLQQGNNTSRNRKFTINGETKNLSEWCRYYNISYSRVYGRLSICKWPILRALTAGYRGGPRQ